MECVSINNRKRNSKHHHGDLVLTSCGYLNCKGFYLVWVETGHSVELVLQWNLNVTRTKQELRVSKCYVAMQADTSLLENMLLPSSGLMSIG
jgi:hypothetical protein